MFLTEVLITVLPNSLNVSQVWPLSDCAVVYTVKFNTRLPPFHIATLKDHSLYIRPFFMLLNVHRSHTRLVRDLHHICLRLFVSISCLILSDPLTKSFWKSWKPIWKRLVSTHLHSWPLVSGTLCPLIWDALPRIACLLQSSTENLPVPSRLQPNRLNTDYYKNLVGYSFR